ncbi:3-isopropylmalate dehydratase large subunit [Treponema primitia]|uniref:3-isopropylmalate dehydratase large subunit n=1 Tax=Treponema primitia TaxID=88058 RepID=UPI0039815871
MGKTMSEKILAHAAGQDTVSADDIFWVKIDKAMMDDILGPRLEIADRLKEIGGKVWDPDKVIIISDHYTPPANEKQANIVKYTREWAKENGCEHYYEFDGPCHQVMVEKGHVLPGEIVVGTDSHTCMYGALAAFGTGIGSTEMAGVLATGQTWLKVPQTVKVEWNGALAPLVMAKDVSLKSIGTVGHAGATYKTIEYCGSTIRGLPMDERLCITNMAVEAGAKAGLIGYDEITAQYLAERGIKGSFEWVNPDADAGYCASFAFDAAALKPQIACPHEVDNVCDIESLEKVELQQVYIGSCTGGRITDIETAAKILKGKKVAKGVRLLVSPASKDVYSQCLKAGLFEILADAGAVVMAATCGACLGVHSGVLGEGESCISTTNRNFWGRMGSKSSNVYLASPASAAASAIVGRIVDPRTI